MKRKGVMIATLALAMPVLLTSCKKDFTCTCQSTNALGVSSTQTYELDNQTRVDAVENCENFEADNAWVTRNCNL